MLLASDWSLNWYGLQLGNIDVANHWQSLARDSIRDDLTWQQRALTIALLQSESEDPLDQQLDDWLQQHQALVSRWQGMLAEIRNASSQEMAMFTVANRELMDLAQASRHSSVPG